MTGEEMHRRLSEPFAAADVEWRVTTLRNQNSEGLVVPFIDSRAIQNRLEHTVNNLEVTSENITAAESRIRDTDMADEITAFTKNNILLQASQSMLAQANAVPQSVLSLLQ